MATWEGGHVALGYSVGRLVGWFSKRWHCRRCLGGKNPAGANVNGHELHDDLQLAGRIVPSQLRRAWDGADRRCDHDRQCQCEHDMSAQLRDAAGFLSNHLRADFAFAVIWLAS